MAFTLTYNETLKKLELKENSVALIKEIWKKVPDSELFFGDEKDLPARVGSLYIIKTSAKNIEGIKVDFQKNIKKCTSATVDFDVDDMTLRFLVSGKTNAISKYDAISTAQQERSSLLFFEKILKNQSHPTIEETKRIYPNVNKEWYNSFVDQAKILKTRWRGGDGSSYIYNRDEGFMEFISAKVKTFGYSKKDAWNPADVWIIKANKEKEIVQTISEIDSIEQLNDCMIDFLKSSLCTGISLKKTGKNIKIEELNTDKNPPIRENVYDLEEFYVPFNEMVNGRFKHLGGKMYLDGRSLFGTIRQFPSTLGIKSNVQMEMTAKGESAHYGKVLKSEMAKVLLSIGDLKIPTWQDTPMTFQEYKEQRNSIYEMIDNCENSDLYINFVIPKNKIIEALDNKYENENENYIITLLSAKMQTLLWADIFANLDKKERNELITDFVYISKKEIKDAGPFIKIS